MSNKNEDEKVTGGIYFIVVAIIIVCCTMFGYISGLAGIGFSG